MNPRQRVLLIHMPFGGIDRPAIGISLLQSALKRDGFHCDLAYFNLLFAEMIGTKNYFRFTNHGDASRSIPYNIFAGDWIFSQYFYGPGSLDAQGYVDGILRSPETGMIEEDIRLVLDMRCRVSSFLRECLSRVLSGGYDVVGFTSTFEQNFASLCLARAIKEAAPAVRIAFGGGNCEGVMGEELHRQFPFIDYVATGEADASFPALLRAVEEGAPVDRIKGIVWRRGGRSVSNGPPEAIRDMDSLPYPDFDDFFRQFRASSFSTEYQPWLQMESARGCWWGERSHCTFCGLNGLAMGFRSKSPGRVLAELDYLTRRYACTWISFVDNIIDWKYLDTVVPELARREQRLNIFYETKSNLKKDHVRLLARAGIRNIQPGIESLSTPILSLMAKGVTALQNVQLVKWCSALGVKAEYNVLYGFPGEDPAAYGQMLEMMKALTHLKPPAAVGPIRLDRFSPNYNEAARRGIVKVRPLPPYQHLYRFNAAARARIAYFFDFDYADGRKPRDYAQQVVQFWFEWLERAPAGGGLEYAPRRRGGSTITDSRFTRVAPRIDLDAVQDSILIFCDEKRTVEDIRARLGDAFPGRTFDDSRIARFLDYMIEHRMMIREGRHFLSVVPLPEGAAVSASNRIRETVPAA